MAYNPSHPQSSFRRSSYASVAAGTAGAAPTAQQGRSISHSAQTATGSSYPPPSHHHSRRPSRGMDVDPPHHSAHGYSTSWAGRGGASQPSSYGYGYGYSMTHLPNSSTHGGFGLDPLPQLAPFFVPSYLHGSRYAERLEDAHNARAAALRDRARTPASSNPGSLSTSASSANLQKMVPSHRGMTHDIVERLPPQQPGHRQPGQQQTAAGAGAGDDHGLPPLPCRWSESDRHKGVDVRADGLQVHFAGSTKAGGHGGGNEEASAVRADQPMPKAAGIYYFECQIQSKQKDVWIGIGFCGPKTPLERMPGWEQESWAYHGDDGSIFNSHATGKPYGGHKYGPLDTVGCGVNFRTGQAFFTKNGVNLGIAFSNIKIEKLYPCVGMKRSGEYVVTNFGQNPFVFDIDGLVKQETQRLQTTISQTSVASLHPPLDEHALIQKLVAQYLAMDGYVETARAFAREVQEDAIALATGSRNGSVALDLEPEEDMDAVNRQQIRAAILEGDIDRALKKTGAYYPRVLEDHENIFFKLKCRKLIEMLRRLSDLVMEQQQPTPSPKKTSPDRNGHADEFGDVFSHQMELDDQLQFSAAASNGHVASTSNSNMMDTDSRPVTAHGNHSLPHYFTMTHKELENETVAYGQELNQLFKDDPRREIKQTLKDTFSMIAYENPRDSPFAAVLDESGRAVVAEELNSAILVSLGKASSSGLERLIQQTEVLVEDLAEDGGVGTLVNVKGDYLRIPEHISSTVLFRVSPHSIAQRGVS